MDNKRRRVLSYENMDPALAAAFAEKYPKGFSDFLPDLTKYEKPDGTPFYAVTVETDDCIALVKIQVQTDDVEDLQRWLDSEGDPDSSSNSSDESDGELPDDNISQYSNAEDDSSEQE